MLITMQRPQRFSEFPSATGLRIRPLEPGIFSLHFSLASAYMALGIFLAPLISGSEPKHQDKLAVILFVALVAVVTFSLGGEYLSYKGLLRGDMAWWLGAQGFEYLDLGRVFQIALTGGLVLWAVIIFRGLRGKLAHEHPGNMPWLFLYSTLSIPLFYGAGMVYGPHTPFAIMDFWRFWVVHLWVEDFLELFTTIAVAYIMVLIGVVHPKTATRLIYLDIILYSIGGVVGTMHHLYFSGAPALHMACGAFFSAMEVIPLVLLTYEAWQFMRLGEGQAGQSVLHKSERFPHRWTVMFLAAVGVSWRIIFPDSWRILFPLCNGFVCQNSNDRCSPDFKFAGNIRLVHALGKQPFDFGLMPSCCSRSSVWQSFALSMAYASFNSLF